ncbi:5-formyltetrahydrofolate cyclo-ligase [Leuconostoc falkenbergense]|uniref:5-formyltetrahydrofolate cyclo-ligase n=2 Tax=Lactobacillaceae TaxID=33958 RepID=UPI00027380CE|nr:5-formyltetrahydrofolate cyclo-ligase [Leuconostoc pseudomesenteroides 1159]KDA49899.1 5-formyltetrahydrofolate cyclo-ligase [Leuconostoc pseudomesenteroides PS12]CCJ66555.1 5-formyltetrahydrofolate cyclo-ligase [Leuconostoc pseudomesenteroides 4882]
MEAGLASFFGEIMINKNEQRQLQKEALKTLSIHQKQTESNRLYQLLFETAAWQETGTIAVTLSMPIELDTAPIIEAAWSANKKTVVPKIVNHQMIFVPFDDGSSLQTGQLSIREPVTEVAVSANKIDMVIVPGLAFTRSGARLGFGAGYYDRFLVNYTGKTIALALSPQIKQNIPIEAHDQLIQEVLTVHTTKE